MALGSRVFWQDVKLPVVAIEAVGPGRDPFDGFIAQLATENEVHVDLTFDPGETEEAKQEAEDRAEAVSMWLYVRHPSSGNLIPAEMIDGEAWYDAWCDDANTCTDDHAQWWEYVTTPSEMFEHLIRLGGLRVRARVTR